MRSPILSFAYVCCVGLVVALQSGCGDGGSPEASHGDEFYYAVPDAEHGDAQSPVNILSAVATPGHHAAVVHYAHAAARCVKNTGHTVEVEFPAGSSLEFDGNAYQLAQLHFHTPSEHQVDGLTYPMEMHVVHVREPALPGDPPEYLVVSVLFRMGESHPFIEGFLGAVPAPGARADLTSAHVFIDEVFPGSELPDHFHYRGSLTTPPYSETVEWLVLEQNLEASPLQIQRINALEGNNARHVQALHRRKVEADH